MRVGVKEWSSFICMHLLYTASTGIIMSNPGVDPGFVTFAYILIPYPLSPSGLYLRVVRSRVAVG
ncbi:hypothetical protein F4810DRAFT_678986 [Camillea tinctor]|nr:hypothetical protein F4810DRAFT_678986 [Camillea tinctor]